MTAIAVCILCIQRRCPLRDRLFHRALSKTQPGISLSLSLSFSFFLSLSVSFTMATLTYQTDQSLRMRIQDTDDSLALCGDQHATVGKK